MGSKLQHGHAGADDGGTLANSIITNGMLSTSTGSASGTSGVNVTGNDYSFMASLTNSSGSQLLYATNMADPGNTVMQISVNGTAGTQTVRWRYINASANPDLWVIADARGNIVAAWESEDPPNHGKPPITLIDHPDWKAVQVAWPDDLLSVSTKKMSGIDFPTPTLGLDDQPGRLPVPSAKVMLSIAVSIELRIAVHPELKNMPRRCGRLQKCFALRTIALENDRAPATEVMARYKLEGAKLVVHEKLFALA